MTYTIKQSRGPESSAKSLAVFEDGLEASDFLRARVDMTIRPEKVTFYNKYHDHFEIRNATDKSLIENVRADWPFNHERLADELGISKYSAM